ncbi:hypothetical protein [Salibacterium qingdaonense]|uniref:Lipoprotein n=1 Tax=Salibacterium qingdaonense TaxID=266892 RepID=A0A1I4LPT3_9BACI|nr:hypothetical protein [Salibacterium qingdaonense]SFL92577.1 hypothetical protein SAMN04488054_10876 [Salibacterium qingdaonense]
MKFLLPLLACIVIMLSSCSIEPERNGENGTTSVSYQAWVRVNGIVYQSQGSQNNGKYTRDEKIGEVKYNLPPDKSIKENFASNYAEEGAAIYAVQDRRNILLVEGESGSYEVFSHRED